MTARALVSLLVGLLTLSGCTAQVTFEPVKVSVTLRYDVTGSPQPIKDVLVELWRFAPRAGGWGWGKDASKRTTHQGVFEAEVPFLTADVKYAFRVFPANTGGQCCVGWSPNGGPYDLVKRPFIEFGEDVAPGTPRHFEADASSNSFAYDHVFSGQWGEVFNVLDVMQQAADFARTYESDVDGDVVVPARIGLAGAGPDDASWYDPVYNTTNLTPRDRLDKWTIIHEYAHFLQAAIGSVAWIASTHNGCVPGAMHVIGPGPNYSWADGHQAPNTLRLQHAWLEGFADWFAEAVLWEEQGGFDVPSASVAEYESRGCATVDLIHPHFGDTLERHVAAYLWDLGDLYSTAEPWDTVGGKDQIRAIMRLVDKELDTFEWPTIQQFVIAGLSPESGLKQTDLVAGNNRIIWPFS